ncbi:hypothetical protein E8E12_000426 [Didymella heteroderae]|uniref:Uncharacterized protein n=1 Tax=Didymella heteroderae TaxID=1769908 RepID=A0A9P5BUA9_9PLEO|nr:hypothetical protein E8E12_000426 [Didymella heteroderae]
MALVYSIIPHVTFSASTDLAHLKPGLSLSSRFSPMQYLNMTRNQQSQGRPQPSVNSSAPPAPAAIDIEIANHNGSTVAIEATPDRLQAAKKTPTPSLSQMVEQLTWQNGQLRSEIDYHQRRHAASLYLLQKTRLIVKSLEQAIENFGSLDGEPQASTARHGEQVMEK